MVDKSTLISSLYGNVGSRQPLGSTVPTLDTANKTSRFGYYVTDNPFVKLEALLDTQDYSSINATDFNALLKQIQERSISDVVNAVFIDSDFIERKMLYDFANNKINYNQLLGFCGKKIKISDTPNIAFEISRVICEFNGTGSLKLLLFNSGKSTPIYTKTVTITSSYQVVELDWVLNDTVVNKGDYYIGYIASPSLKPYDRNFELSNLKNVYTHLNIQNIQVSSHTTETLFDLNQIEYTSIDCGLNLDITVYKDYTRLIIENESLFSSVICNQFACNIINYYPSTIRSNINERLSLEFLSRAMVYLNGQTEPNIIGLTQTVGNEIKLLRQQVKRLIEQYQPNKMQIVTLS